MPRKRIIIDMDEVLADVIPKFTTLYKKYFGKELQPADYAGMKIYDLPGAAHIRNHLHDKGFFLDLPVMPHAREVVRWLSGHYDIYIATSAMEFPNSLPDKYEWLRREFPFIHWRNLIFCGSKEILTGDYMIDDHVSNVARFGGKPLLYTASHNLHERRFTRVNNWLEVRAFFEKELQRQQAIS